MAVHLPNCRLCGSRPEIIASGEVVPGESSWAIFCPNPDCYNDTHWQNSLTQASTMWANNPCVNERGGQGDQADDQIH